MTDDRRQRVEQIYLDALDIPAVDRPGFLDRACEGDRDLRSEVEALLALQPAAETFLEAPAIESAARTLADILPALRPPDIPGYKIIRHLGEGGMGLVYLAEQEAPLRRLVALKVIRPGMDSRQIVARFNAERQALAQMDHPNIAAVHDAGETADGRPYFVMEFVDGLPISVYCDRKGFPTAERLELFTQVCAAVQHAHQKGVIHRDLKPSNVLVTEQDGRPMPKVIDFGTAKAIARSREAGAVTLTAHGMVLGTIEYMSPEQAAFSRDIDTTTDVYSLGVMLYELLVGVLPFERPRPGPEGYDELRRLIRESDPPRPSARLSNIAEARRGIAPMRQSDPERLRRSLQGDLDWIAMKALEKDRTRRYPTVAAFASDIHRFLSDQTVEARPPSAAYRIRKFTRRHRGAVAAAVALFVVLVAGLAVSRSQYLRAEDARIESESRRAALALSEYRNYAMTIAAADAEIGANRFSDARERLLTVPAAMRGWEWDHLFLRAESALRTLADRLPCLPGQPARSDVWAIDTLGKDPDGKRIYFRRCQRVNHWNTETLEHSVAVSDSKVIVAAAPSGRTVLTSRTVTSSGPARKWNVYVSDSFEIQSSRLVATVDRPPACADLSPDGRILALGFGSVTPSAFKTDVFEVWDTQSSRRTSRVVLSRPRGADTRLNSPTDCFVRLSPDTTLLATSGAVVGVWGAATGAQLHVDSGQAGVLPQAIAFSPTARQLAIGRRNGLIDVLDFRSSNWFVRSLDGMDVVRFPSLSERDRISAVWTDVRAIAFAPDGQTLVSSQANRVVVWDLPSARAQKVFDAHESAVTGLVVDGQFVYSADTGGTVKVQALQEASGVTRLEGSEPLRGPFAISADGRVVAQGLRAGSLAVWHPDERRHILLQPAAGSSQANGAWTSVVLPLSDNRTILTGGAPPGTLVRWDSETQQAFSLPTIDNMEPGCEAAPRPFRAAVSPDDRSFAMMLGNCVVVRELATNKTLAVLRVDRPEFYESRGSYIRFLSDESILVAATHRYEMPRSLWFVNSVIRWDWRTNRRSADRVFPAKTSQAVPVTVSHDGRRIALGEEEFVMVWDGTLTREIGRIPIPQGSNSLMAFSADGTRLAVRTLDRTSLSVWDTEKFQALLTLMYDDVPTFLAFTSSGQLIAANSSGGLTVWETRPKCPQCSKFPVRAK